MKPKNSSMIMLQQIDILELSNKFTLEEIANNFRCSTQFVRNEISRQEIKRRVARDELKAGVRNNFVGAWSELKETELFKRLMEKK